MGNIGNQVYRLRNYAELQMPGYADKLKFQGGQEFHIINNVLYMGGHPVTTNMQVHIVNWITSNPNLFIGDTRKF